MTAFPFPVIEPFEFHKMPFTIDSCAFLEARLFGASVTDDLSHDLVHSYTVTCVDYFATRTIACLLTLFSLTGPLRGVCEQFSVIE